MRRKCESAHRLKGVFKMVFGENAVARTRISLCSSHRYHGGTFVWNWATEIRTQDELTLLHGSKPCVLNRFTTAQCRGRSLYDRPQIKECKKNEKFL